MPTKILPARMIICFLLLSLYSKAQTQPGYAVPFLTIAPDARSSGMGETGIATAPDANASFWNLGKIPFSEKTAGITATYSPWLKQITNDVSFASLAGFYKPDEFQAFSVNFRYFNLGEIKFSSENNESLGSVQPNELALNLGYSRKLSDRLGLGLSMGFIHSSILQGAAVTGSTGKAGTAIASNLGLYYDLQDGTGNGWAFGANLKNLGSKISYFKQAEHKDFLPASLGIGASWNKNISDEHRLSIAADINKLLIAPLEEDTPAALAEYYETGVAASWMKSFSDFPGRSGISLGAEYWYKSIFAIRAGYFTESKAQGNKSYATAGAAIGFNNLEVYFSYLNTVGKTNNILNNTLRFGLSYHFGSAVNYR